MLLTIVAGVIVLSVLVLVHELGHFLMAKATGCWVKEFGVGFPPRIWGKKYGDTIYSVNWIPFGGFNAISGEVDPKEPRALAARSHLVRLGVLSGGMIMNLILPFILLAVAYMVPHDITKGRIEVQSVAAGSPAALAGVMAGDTILKVDGHEVDNTGDLSRYVLINLGRQISLTIRHSDGATAIAKVVPRWKPPSGQSSTGSVSQTVDYATAKETLPVWKAIPKGFSDCIETFRIYVNGIAEMVVGALPFVPSGPVGIVQVTGEVAHAGISPLLELTAFISIAIALTQLIPFPSLDGARMAFVIVEWARRGKRVSPRVESIVHSVGFIILLGLMLLVTYQDIVRWITGGSLVK